MAVREALQQHKENAAHTDAEHQAALQAKADAQEAVERQNGVSDNEMALHYAKYQKFLKPNLGCFISK